MVLGLDCPFLVVYLVMNSYNKFINFLNNNKPEGVNEVKDLKSKIYEHGYDSLDLMTLLLDIETEFKIKIKENEVDKIKSFEDLYNLIRTD